jgi:hypothetical protein
LRVLGLARRILFSFIESVLAGGARRVIGCLLVLLLNGITTGIGNFVTFSEIDFISGDASDHALGVDSPWFWARWADRFQHIAPKEISPLRGI